VRRNRFTDKESLLFLIIGIALFVFPFIYEDRSMLILFTQIFIFAIFAMSYDILLGFTGIVSFGHAMFFGIGAYCVSVMLKHHEPTMLLVTGAISLGVLFSLIISFVVGLMTLRLKSHYYAMLTLALAGLFLVAAEKWRTLTYGNDGFTFQVPEFFHDRLHFYLVCLVLMVIVYFGLKRFIQSPLGRILLAIKDNEQRAESLGYQVLHYKIIASIVAGGIASLSGSLYALSLRFVNTSVFTMDITLDALLMTIIGGVGTLIGPVLGAAIIELAHHWLTGLAKVHWIFERWLILFGIVYILAVMFFPNGIVGSVRKLVSKKEKKEDVSTSENIVKEG